MRSFWLAAFLLLAACGEDGPQNGVDTTLPTEPAKISGTLVAPDDYLPSDIRVCAETAAGRTVSCNAKIESSVYSGSYEIEVPPGSYRIYATSKDVPNFKAYYPECSEPNCSSHVPAVVKVEEGEARTGIDPSWADRPAPTYNEPDSEYTDMNAVDMNAVDMNATDQTTDSGEPPDE